jgi:two-component system osmolarity sensor histidine kinase EnvZ
VKRLIPKSLLVRAFLLIVVLILVSLGASVSVLRHAEQEPNARQMAQLVVSVVNLTRAAVLSAAPEWRVSLLVELADAEGLRVHLAETGDVLTPLPDHPPELRMMVDKVQAKLGKKTRFAVMRNGIEALWVSFNIGQEEFWVALPHEHIEHPVSQVWLIWSSVVLLLALLGAYYIARQVTYPLKQLALAAKLTGQGQHPPRLPEQGAQEVIAVSAAFNQMSADLAVNERERALVLAGISHDLRTPLARVRLAAEMSQDDFLREGLIADVGQMDEVIRQFLDYAKLDESEAFVLTDISLLVQEAIQPYLLRAVSVILELQTVPRLIVRPLLLKRALSNLLDNVVKYGGGEITIQLYREAGNVILAVADRGVGILKADRAAAKRPFIRLDVARSDVTGSGLGLAIVERAARLHQGEFELSEREGGGLIARLILPV